MSTFSAIANLSNPVAKALQGGYPYGGNGAIPVAHTKDPLPEYGIGGSPQTVPAGYTFTPVKPLPGGGGSGGPTTVGYGI